MGEKNYLRNVFDDFCFLQKNEAANEGASASGAPPNDEEDEEEGGLCWFIGDEINWGEN